jgi:predicted nucleic acid-binding protein
MNRLLIDTNILVYAKDASSVFHQVSTTLLKSDNQLFTTSKNLTDYAVVTKGENPLLHPAEALQDLIDFSSICTILFPTETSTQLLSQFVSKHLPKRIKDS